VSNLPANRTTVYGTSSCPGFSRTLTIAFARPVNQVSLDVYNGIGASVDYTVVSDGGSVQTKTLAPHVQSGQARFTIRDRGIGSVTISDGLDGFWDFFIDNISYSSDSSLLDLPPEVLLQMYLSGQITFEQLQQAWAELARRYIPPVTAGCSITQDRSLPSTTTSEITFVNESGQVVDIYWINFNGDFVLYNTLQPGGSYVQRTFLNHAWVVRTKAGQCIGYTISDAPSKTYVIQTSGGGGRPG
jgi:hypothetical protein